MVVSRCGVFLLLCSSMFVSSCPSGCCCPPAPPPGGGALVLCESLGLRSLPGSVPLSTRVLSVSRNQLCDVDHQLTSFSRLQQLSLSHNQLSRFPRGLPPSLEVLLLQENRIGYVTAGVLRQLGNLTRLHLEHNVIRAMQPGALRPLLRLQLLSLKGNKLTRLPVPLPSSLTRLDLSVNCISVLDAASLTPLWNLQVLKINSNCLRSVAENALDRLPRLRTLDLADNLWACHCDIIYLYRWLLASRPRMATDLVCTEPPHLAHRLLLNLSAVAVCPRLLKPNNRTRGGDPGSAHEKENPTAKKIKQKNPWLGLVDNGNVPDSVRTRLVHFSLETLTFEQCLSLNEHQPAPPPSVTTPPTAPTPPPEENQRCRENITARGTPSFPASTNGDGVFPSVRPRAPSAAVALLAVLCVLVAMLTLAALVVLKQTLLRRQRVAPLNVLPTE